MDEQLRLKYSAVVWLLYWEKLKCSVTLQLDKSAATELLLTTRKLSYEEGLENVQLPKLKETAERRCLIMMFKDI